MKANARNEIKHSLNFGDYQILKSRLNGVLQHDENIGPSGEYVVKSLYFDTPGDRALTDKLNGVLIREKFRFRRYNNDTDFIRLEKKSKNNSICYKSSVRVTKEEVAAVIAGNLDWMAGDERELIVELYSKMRGQLLKPKTIVEYIREPFVFVAGDVRITFDRDIRTGILSTDFLDENLPTLPAGDEFVLLEVKYNNFIPDFIVKLLQLQNRRASSCSKYALSRIYG